MSDSFLDLGANTGAGRWWAMGKFYTECKTLGLQIPFTFIRYRGPGAAFSGPFSQQSFQSKSVLE